LHQVFWVAGLADRESSVARDARTFRRCAVHPPIMDVTADYKAGDGDHLRPASLGSGKCERDKMNTAPGATGGSRERLEALEARYQCAVSDAGTGEAIRRGGHIFRGAGAG